VTLASDRVCETMLDAIVVHLMRAENCFAKHPQFPPLQRTTSKEAAMLWTIAVILLVLWALGMVTSYTLGGVAHLLLVLAVIVIVFQFIGGRRST
jgi:hypothetical protein